MERKEFKDVISDLTYVFVDNTMEKSADDVAGEIREMISSWGWPAAESQTDADCWIDEHPEINTDGWEECSVADVEFLCDNTYYERCGRDVDFYTFQITFYGIWGNEGIFMVSH